MAIKSGFFNSDAGDRKYDAEDINKFFDGVVTDGVLSAIGDTLLVVPSSGMQIASGSGKAWFLKSWIENTSNAFRTLSASDVTYDRIDTIAIDFDKSDQVRENDIIVVTGTPAASPVPPTLIDTSTHLQKPLAHILVEANVTVIDAGDITNKVGTVDCPFSTGVTELIVEVDDVTIEIVEDELRVKDSGITASKIATAAVGTNEIAAGAVKTAELDADAVTGDKIADDAINSEHYTNLSIDRVHLVADIIDGTKIADNVINSEHYAPDSIDGEHYAPNSVGSAAIAAGVVDTLHLAEDAVTQPKIGPLAVGTTELASDAVTQPKIGPLAVGATEIALNAVDDTKVGNRVPMVTRRQGGSATEWAVAGSTNYTLAAVKIQCGLIYVGNVGAGASASVAVTFPQAFAYSPVALVTNQRYDSTDKISLMASPSSTTLSIYATNHGSSTELVNVFWFAMGPE